MGSCQEGQDQTYLWMNLEDIRGPLIMAEHIIGQAEGLMSSKVSKWPSI